jgi:hypothetical protein
VTWVAVLKRRISLFQSDHRMKHETAETPTQSPSSGPSERIANAVVMDQDTIQPEHVLSISACCSLCLAASWNQERKLGMQMGGNDISVG